MTSIPLHRLSPSQPLSSRRIRAFDPLCVTSARVAALLLGLGVSLIGHPRGSRTETHVAILVDDRPEAVYSASASKARRARLARARAAARAREQARMRALQEAMTPRYKTDATGALVPDIRAAAAIIFNPETGQVLWEENAQDKRSIASITKVMTALVFLEDNPDLAQEVTVERSDVYAASTTYLRANERITLDNLLHLTLDRVGQRRRPRAGARLARRHARRSSSG